MSPEAAELLRELRENPELREQLRVLLFGDAPDLQGALGALAEAQRHTDERLGALAGDVRELAAELRALTADVRELTADVRALTADVREIATEQVALTAEVRALSADVRELAAAQRVTEVKLSALLDVVAGMTDKLAKLDGRDLERQYREKGHAYFSRLARRLRLLDGTTLAPLVDDAEQAGLSEREANAILLADAIFSGRSRSNGAPLHLVVEASVTIARHDVRRARERADLFARIAQTPVMAVVAGEFAPRPVAEAAQQAGVWLVTNGRAVSPDDDLDELLST